MEVWSVPRSGRFTQVSCTHITRPSATHDQSGCGGGQKNAYLRRESNSDHSKPPCIFVNSKGIVHLLWKG